MSATEKKAYLKKKFGNQGDYTKIALASFQRAGWSSVMPPFMDMILGQVAPEYRFNTRSSGQEMNLITGNPTYSLIFQKLIPTVKAVSQSTFNPERTFSSADGNKAIGLLPLYNLIGLQQFLRAVASELPDERK